MDDFIKTNGILNALSDSEIEQLRGAALEILNNSDLNKLQNCDCKKLYDQCEQLKSNKQLVEENVMKLQEEIKMLQKKLDAFEKSNVPDTKITIDVGGTLFTTTTSTLMKSPYFEALLSVNFKQPKEREHHFIDFDPDDFKEVLYYLRTNNYLYKPKTYAMDFFGL